MTSAPSPLLIIANSARMLALAVKESGFTPLVIDLYADLDTQSCALDFKKIDALTWKNLEPALEYFIEHYAVTEMVYGSGFEYHPDSLQYLSQRLTILGNSPEIFSKLHDKTVFFKLLNRLNIPSPEVSFTKPDDPEGWLIKPVQGQGGVGIKRYDDTEPVNTGIYWQRYQQGSQHSVLFLADGKTLQVIGFNTQWTVHLSESAEFMFAGLINHCALSDAQKALIGGWLNKLVPALGLKGLCSLDFIHSGTRSFVLEINPRPPASMQLYGHELLRGHIACCKGNKPAYPGKQHAYTGLKIVYALRDTRIPEHFIWPEFCRDLPGPLAFIPTGQPICSIIASKKQAQAVLKQLLNHQQSLEKGLYPHEIPRKC